MKPLLLLLVSLTVFSAPFQEFYGDGSVYSELYQDRKLCRKLWYNPDGTIESFVDMLNDVKHGLHMSFWNTGEIRSVGRYVNGVQDGEYMEYSKAGYVTYYVIFLNDRIIYSEFAQ
jgi:antitoxin component YwqK of YwqJK toxin-antitoxin module